MALLVDGGGGDGKVEGVDEGGREVHGGIVGSLDFQFSIFQFRLWGEVVAGRRGIVDARVEYGKPLRVSCGKGEVLRWLGGSAGGDIMGG
jgi:hypothetical protein